MTAAQDARYWMNRALAYEARVTAALERIEKYSTDGSVRSLPLQEILRGER